MAVLAASPRWSPRSGSRALLLVTGAILILGRLVLAYRAQHSDEREAAGQAAQHYAQTTTLWSSGPTVRSVQILPVKDLRAALRTAVAPGVAADVNVDDLARRVGSNRRVALVVLNGVHNSLPPDEGVNVNGDVVAIVDLNGDRVLLLTD